MVDGIVDRREMRNFVIKALDFMMNPDIGEKSQVPTFKFQVSASPS